VHQLSACDHGHEAVPRKKQLKKWMKTRTEKVFNASN
jgi:hypothetical protein